MVGAHVITSGFALDMPRLNWFAEVADPEVACVAVPVWVWLPEATVFDASVLRNGPMPALSSSQAR